MTGLLNDYMRQMDEELAGTDVRKKPTDPVKKSGNNSKKTTKNKVCVCPFRLRFHFHLDFLFQISRNTFLHSKLYSKEKNNTNFVLCFNRYVKKSTIC